MTEQDITKLGKKAIEDTRKENILFELPNVISENGKILYELPSGEIKDSFDWKLVPKYNAM